MIGRNRVRQAQDVITLQYANGKSMARQVGSSGRFAPYVGFHIEVGKDSEIDTALSAARVTQIEIKHQRPGGAEIIRHWGLGETVRLYPVTSGPVAPTVAASLAGKNADATAEAGIGLRWGEHERSKLAIRGYLDLLVQAGSLRLVQLSVRSRMTDELLKALIDHGRVCEAADSLVDRARHPEVVCFHEIALPLGPGEEELWGKTDTTSVTPFRSMHPALIDADYLRGGWRPDSVHAAALRDWDGIQFWAREYASQAEEAGRGPEAVAANGAEDVL
ncbi:MAG: hypothetical protein OHK0015_33920 [Chloroflexi bacterium OHK40]|jgi:hypothetical protein